MRTLPAFDGGALIRALDAERDDRGLTWNTLADELWQQSADLNARLTDHALCPGALVRTAKRETMSCQYALILLRWIRRAPEDFLVGAVVDVGDVRLRRQGQTVACDGISASCMPHLTSTATSAGSLGRKWRKNSIARRTG